MRRVPNIRDKTVIVVGAGFAGLASVKQLCKLQHKLNIILFDKNKYTTMLPCLPDVAGGKIHESLVQGDISRLIGRLVDFLQENVLAVDASKKMVITDKKGYSYDYLIIASGSVTNFYNFDKGLESMHKLDSLSEALKIRDDVRDFIATNHGGHLVLSGAGYTGLELACALRFMAATMQKTIPITIVEMQDEVLPFLNPRERVYVRRYLSSAGIDILLRSRITDFNGTTVVINDAMRIDNALVCWTAGSRCALGNLQGIVERLDDGRIVVNEYLELPHYPEVFVAGDSAAMRYRNAFLRRSVNFAITSGRQAGKNLVALVEHTRMSPYHPIDLGWVIPLHGISVGRLFGNVSVKGKLGLRLHYGMSGYRNYSLSNFLSFVKIAQRLFNTIQGGTI